MPFLILGALLIVLAVGRATGEVTAALLSAILVAVVFPDPWVIAFSSVALLLSQPFRALRR